MKRNALYIFLILLLATALTALAQSPTTSNMGGSETKAPYGATLDHPNPSSAPSATEPNVPAASAPAATTPSTSSTTTSTTVDNTSGSSTSTPDTSGTAPDTSVSGSTTDTSGTGSGSSTAGDTASTSGGSALPRTASDLPLLTVIGLLAVAGALMVRSLARRNA
jgi:cytoskeletal protein RodZ